MEMVVTVGRYTTIIVSSRGNLNRLAYLLQFLFVFLAAASVFFFLAVATFSEELNENEIRGLNSLKVFAFTATISSTLVSAF